MYCGTGESEKRENCHRCYLSLDPSSKIVATTIFIIISIRLEPFRIIIPDPSLRLVWLLEPSSKCVLFWFFSMGNNFDLLKMRKNLKLFFGSWNRHIWSVFGVNFDNQMTYDWIPTQNFVNFHFEKNNLQSSISVEFQGNFWSLVSFYFFCNVLQLFPFSQSTGM